MNATLVLLVLSLGLAMGQDQPTLFPVNPFDPSADVDVLYEAFNGIGTNEADIISILCYRVASQRDADRVAYNELYGCLGCSLDSYLSGNFKTLSFLLIESMTKFLSTEINEIIFRIGSNEPQLTEVIMSRTNQELQDVSDFYVRYYGDTLVSDLQKHTSGAYKDLISQMSLGQRDESNVVDMALVESDVNILYEGGPMITGADEQAYINVFALRNFAHIDQVSIVYEATYGKPLSTMIKEEFNGDMQNALVAILQYSKDKASYFANRFFVALDGLGTDDRDLMRLVVSRCETDLGNIKTAYQNLYGETLNNAVMANSAGSYEDALIALLG